ncbi:hypothetical protein D9M71_796940 [compost metagenome]
MAFLLLSTITTDFFFANELTDVVLFSLANCYGIAAAPSVNNLFYVFKLVHRASSFADSGGVRKSLQFKTVGTPCFLQLHAKEEI